MIKNKKPFRCYGYTTSRGVFTGVMGFRREGLHPLDLFFYDFLHSYGKYLFIDEYFYNSENKCVCIVVGLFVLCFDDE